MDPIEAIQIQKDTTFALLLAAQQRNWTVYYLKMGDLYLHQQQLYGRTAVLQLQPNCTPWFTLQQECHLPLHQLDAILVRKDPPFDQQYLYLTHLLEHVAASGTQIINSPQALRDCNEKLLTTWFPDLIPETLVTQRSDLIQQFHAQYGNIVLKPLDGMGGKGIFHIAPQGANLATAVEILTQQGRCYCIAQRYLPAVHDTGDKRIFIVHGVPIPYCLTRFPAQGEIRANLAVGGRGEVHPLTQCDWAIARRVASVAQKKGLALIGLDVIGPYLTEINITSPTGIRQIEAACSLSICAQLLDNIEQQLK